MNIPERLPYILRIFRKCFEFGQFLTPLDALHLLILEKVYVADYSMIPILIIYHI